MPFMIMKRKIVAVTSDLWTSNTMQSYITLTGHFVDDRWNLNSLVFGTRLVTERHTGVNIAREVDQRVSGE